MRVWLFLGSLGCVMQIQAQISVYDCGAISQIVTQSEIEAANNEYYKQCIMFIPPETYEFNGSLNRKVTAATNIHLREGVHIGPFTQDGQFWMQIQPKSDFDVAVMNYENLNNVLRYKKFEIGIKLPQEIQDAVDNYVLDLTGDKINPFLENELDIEIKFTHQSSGQTKSIDCFYYREYQRNSSLTDWDELPTEYDIRGRYAPPLNGKWEAYVVIKVAGVPYMESQVFLFNVIESGDPGYVKVHENNRNLKRGDRMIFPVGHNLPSPYVGVKRYHNLPYGEPEMSPNMTHKAAKPNNWVDYLNDVASYGDQGGRFIRTLQTPWSSLIEFEKLGNYYDRLHYAWEQDKLLEICEERDILIQYNLMIHEPIMKVGDYSYTLWDWDRYDNLANYMPQDPYPVYCYNTDPQNKEPYQMFLIEEDLKFHEQRTRYYISRYGYSTNIYEFEILSEPWHLNEMDIDQEVEPPPVLQDNHYLQDIVELAIKNYHERISTFVKYELGHDEHLIGVDLILDKWYPNNESGYIDLSPVHEAIDIIGVNIYSYDPKKFILAQGSSNTENSYFARVSYLQNLYNKPVLFSECGHDDVHSCSSYLGHEIDSRSMGFNSIAGFNFWSGFDYGIENGFIDTRTLLWPTSILAQNHMNSDIILDVISNGNGQYIQGRQTGYVKIFNEDIGKKVKSDIKELQYYVSADKESSCGYVRNRTYNYFNFGNQTGKCAIPSDDENMHLEIIDVQWNQGEKLEVEGLKSNTDYQILWYDYSTFEVWIEECQNTTSNGKLKLKHPTLFANISSGQSLRPTILFSIFQNNCQGKAYDYDASQRESQSRNSFSNPSSEFLYINFYEGSNSLKILTLDGKVVRSGTLDIGKNVFYVSDLMSGMYILIIGDSSYKLIIEQ